MRADVLTQRHRAQQIVVQRDTVRRVRSVWPALDWADLDGTYPALAAKVAPIVAANRRTSSALASAYTKAMRAKHVRGSFTPIPAPPVPAGQFTTSLQVTSVVALKKAASHGTPAEQALLDALVQASGAMSRLALDGGRFTVTRTSVADPRCRGWERVGVGECDFCAMLLGRGAVYSEETADFEAHDHCQCSAEPVYT
jgi:hypothetical protein